MIGLLTEGLRSGTQRSLISQGLAADFVARLILFCPPVFSLLLIQQPIASILQINNIKATVEQIDNLKLLVSICDDS